MAYPRRRRPLPPSLLRRKPAAPPSRAPRIAAQGLALIGVAALLLLLGTVGGAYTAYAQLADSLKPRLDSIANPDDFQTTRLLDRHGNLLYEFFGTGRRTRVPIDKIAPDLIRATVAIEDKTFFRNEGVDFVGIVRTGLSSLVAGEETGGGSTITQQVIKRVVLSERERAYDNRYQRKLTEIILAQELTQRYTKNDILTLYLNDIYYGNLAYGIEAAAQTYFGTDAAQLTLPQAAMLAGLPQLPSDYDPFAYAEANTIRGVTLADGWLRDDYRLAQEVSPPKWRQIAVLRQMVDEGYITDQAARQSAAQDLPLSKRAIPLNAPHFVFYVRKLLEDQYGPEFANRGLSVITSIDLDVQAMAQAKASERIAELETRNIHNASVVVMQPNTGQILAMVGSIDYYASRTTTTPNEKGNVLDGQVNVATRLRQPGSALKPFTYLAAMERGMTPETPIWDVPTGFPAGDGTWYEPKNYNGRWNGPVRMRLALANSLNMPAVKTLKLAGIDRTLGLLRRVGISSLGRGSGFYGLSLTLGGGEVTPLELTAAYNTLASGGRYYAPTAILKIVDGAGTTLQEYQPVRRPTVVDPDNVTIINDMLSDDTARQPVWGLNSKLKLSRPAAVKTGTSNDWRDAWAVGYTPFVTVGVWTGNNNNEPTSKVESLTGGGVIWHNIMEELFTQPKFQALLATPYPSGRLPETFPMPSWMQRRPVCPLPGRFAGPSQELFAPSMRSSLTISGTAALSTSAALSTNALSSTADISGTAALSNSADCDLYARLRIARIPEGGIAGTATLSGTTALTQRYCRPEPPESVPPASLTTILLWKLPPADAAERVRYTWENMASSVGGVPVLALSPEQIPLCDLTRFFPPTPVPQIQSGPDRMPDLRRLGENQAKARLAELGIANAISVDYQTRDRIPEIFDQYPPYAVVSTLPAPGEPIPPDATIVLGVRAPE